MHPVVIVVAACGLGYLLGLIFIRDVVNRLERTSLQSMPQLLRLVLFVRIQTGRSNGGERQRSRRADSILYLVGIVIVTELNIWTNSDPPWVPFLFLFHLPLVASWVIVAIGVGEFIKRRYRMEQ